MNSTRTRKFSFWIACFVLFAIAVPNLYLLCHLVYEEYWIHYADLHISDDPDQIYNDAVRKIEYGAASNLIEDLGAAIEKFPNYHKFRMLRGSLYQSSGELDKAKEDLTIAYDSWPGVFEFRFLMSCLFAKTEYSEIIIYCDDRLGGTTNLNAEAADIWTIAILDSRALAYLFSGKYQDAINDFDFILLISHKIPQKGREEYLARIEKYRAHAIECMRSTVLRDTSER